MALESELLEICIKCGERFNRSRVQLDSINDIPDSWKICTKCTEEVPKIEYKPKVKKKPLYNNGRNKSK